MLDILETQLRQEFDSLKCKKTSLSSSSSSMDYLSKFTSAYCPQNMCKNRYYNILPNEESRVKLNALVDGDGDYINANYVGSEKLDLSVGGGRKKYILTQAPLPNTMNDLWRMVWQEKVPVIACLTKLSEGEVQKAHKYWPDDGETMQFGKIIVYHSFTVVYSNIIVRTFSLWLEGDPLNAIEVFHLHYQDWPDHGTPASTQPIRTLAYLVSTLRDRACTNGPVVAHCSAGVGRAGTFVAIHMILNQLEKMVTLSQPPPLKFSINVKETVSKLRAQREGTVQTVDQYIFIYKVIADFICAKRNSMKQQQQQQLQPLESDHYVLSLQDSHNSSPSISSPSVSSPSLSSSASSAFFMDILSFRSTKCSKEPEDHSDLTSSAEVR